MFGFLTSQAADDPVSQAYMAGLLQGLQELGWTVGRNVRIDSRWGAIDPAPGPAEAFGRD